VILVGRRSAPFLALLLCGCWERYSFVNGQIDALAADSGTSPDSGNADPADVAPTPPDSPMMDALVEPDMVVARDGQTDPQPGTIVPVEIQPIAVSISGQGGTAIVEVSLRDRAPAGGFAITIASNSQAVVVPPRVVVPEGAFSVGVRIRSAASDGTAQISASISGRDSSVATATVTLAASIPPPAPGDLVINEINYDVPTINGDANCDGEVGAFPDEFIELSNRSSHPVQMLGVSLWDEFGFTSDKPRFTFPGFVLGSGETVVIFGGPLGSTGTAPWCKGLGPASIGDAAAFGNPAGFNLDNAGDTVHVTAGPGSASTSLTDPVILPPGGNQSWTRGPDFAGPFVKHTEVPGHAPDRKWTPGTLVSGAPFAAASP
jgi:hypothetical protein